MENIVLNEISGQDFGAFFKKLNWTQRATFVREHRSEIKQSSNVEALTCLLDYGYFNALYPLVATGENIADKYIMIYYSSPIHKFKTYPSCDEEKEILAYIAKDLELAKFLREKTNKLWDLSSKVYFTVIVFENASKEVMNYLVDWHSKNFVPISFLQANAMFNVADPDVIRKYLSKVGSICGNHGYVTYKHLKNLAQRTDIDADEKHELLLLTVNSLKVRPEIIRHLRADGLLDF